jgi:hypothetical protein
MSYLQKFGNYKINIDLQLFFLDVFSQNITQKAKDRATRTPLK